LPLPRPTLFPYTTLFRSQVSNPVCNAPQGDASVSPTPNQDTLGRPRRTRMGRPPGDLLQHRVRQLLLARREELLLLEADVCGQRSEEHTSELQSRENLVC